MAPPLLVALHGGRSQLAVFLAALAHFLHTLPPALFVAATTCGEVPIILLQVIGRRLLGGQSTVRGTHFGPIKSPFDSGAWPGSQLTPASL